MNTILRSINLSAIRFRYKAVKYGANTIRLGKLLTDGIFVAGKKRLLAELPAVKGI